MSHASRFLWAQSIISKPCKSFGHTVSYRFHVMNCCNAKNNFWEIFQSSEFSDDSLARWQSKCRPIYDKYVIFSGFQVRITKHIHRKSIVTTGISMHENNVFLTAVPSALSQPIAFFHVELKLKKNFPISKIKNSKVLELILVIC